ncbi:MAG: hypothetical protein ACP5N2_01010 [Candidatus Nanoarchaeia archaeon]
MFNLEKEWFRNPMETMRWFQQKYPVLDDDLNKIVTGMMNHGIFYGYFYSLELMSAERTMFQEVITAALAGKSDLDFNGAKELYEYHENELKSPDFFDKYKFNIGYLILNNKCEWDCIDCGNFSTSKGTSALDYFALEKFISNNADKIAPRALSIVGGDAFEYESDGKNISDVVLLLSELGVPGVLVTTGGIKDIHSEKAKRIEEFYETVRVLNMIPETGININPFSPGVLNDKGEINESAFKVYVEGLKKSVEYIGKFTDKIGVQIRYAGNLKERLDDVYYELVDSFSDITFKYGSRCTVNLGRGRSLQEKVGLKPMQTGCCGIFYVPSGFTILPDQTLTPCNSLSANRAGKPMNLASDMNNLPKLFHEFSEKKYSQMLDSNFDPNICNVC